MGQLGLVMVHFGAVGESFFCLFFGRLGFCKLLVVDTQALADGQRVHALDDDDDASAKAIRLKLLLTWRNSTSPPNHERFTFFLAM